MKIYNIVYVSKYGFASRYANMLKEKLGVDCYDLKSAKKNLKKGEPIIFVSGLNNNRLNELKKASKLYDIKSVLAVGMSFYRETLPELIRIVNGFDEGFPLYYAQGGLDPNKISKLERFMIQMSLGYLNQVTELTEEDRKTADMLGNAADYVDETKLYPFYAYLLDDDNYLTLYEQSMIKEEIVQESIEEDTLEK